MVSTNTIKTCRNCGRKKPIIGDGLDSSCYWSVYKKFTKGTPEYDAALAKAKIKFSDPNYKRKSGKRPDKEISPDVKALSIKHNGGDPEMSRVIAAMQMEHERLLAKADKLAQAIKLLQ